MGFPNRHPALKGVFLMCREAARQMIAMKRKGRLINIGSGSAVIARPNAGPHAASKAGAAHLTRVMSLELGPHGITVNTVCPGLTDIGPTSHYGGSTPDYQKNFLPEVPMGRLARPEEVSRCRPVFRVGQGALHHGPARSISTVGTLPARWAFGDGISRHPCRLALNGRQRVWSLRRVTRNARRRVVHSALGWSIWIVRPIVRPISVSGCEWFQTEPGGDKYHDG